MARKQKKITLTAAARALNVSQPTLSAWEGERKNPSVDSLIRMSELYGVSVDYLLGLPAERYHRADLLQPIPVEIIPIFHETPVFSIDRGWAMVDAIEGVLHFADGATQPLAKLVDTCYVLPPAHVIPGMVTEKPLYRDELMDHDTVWVEPISMDSHLRMELRGWYHVKTDLLRTKWGNVSILISMISNG